MKNFVSVDNQKKHLTKKEISDRRKIEDNIKTKISKKDFKVPSYLNLNKEEKKLWDNLLKIIFELNEEFTTKIDIYNVESLFNAICNYRQATQDIRENGIIYRSKNAKGQEYTAINPALTVQKSSDEIIKKTMNTLGLTLEARIKIGNLRKDEIRDEIDEELGLDI